MKTKHPGNLLSLALAFILLVSVTSCNQVAIVIPTATNIPTATTLQSGEIERKLMVNALSRSYLLHIPPNLDRRQRVPVVFAFHGFAQAPSSSMSQSGFNDIADKHGFVVVYPRGTAASDNGSLSWNAGTCCGYASENNVDEAAFVRQILADLGTIVSIDPKRIYATGFSNGAMLTYRLACEMSDTFAAVAPVAGVLIYSPCQLSQPVSVMHVHGMADTIVPFSGGGEGYPPVEDSIATWVQLDDCNGSPTVETKKTGKVTITHTVYASCRAGTAIELYTNDTAGHSWTYSPTSETIWDFFAAHPKP